MTTPAMNPLGELLGVEDIELDLDVSGKEALLARIAAMLARRGRLVRQPEAMGSPSFRRDQRGQSGSLRQC